LFLQRKKIWGEETHENNEKQSVYIYRERKIMA